MEKWHWSGSDPEEELQQQEELTSTLRIWEAQTFPLLTAWPRISGGASLALGSFSSSSSGSQQEALERFIPSKFVMKKQDG